MTRQLLLYRVLANPAALFRELAGEDGALSRSLLSLAMLLLLLPPLFAAIGGGSFGWRLGTESPLVLSAEQVVLISVLYWLLLCFGFFSTVLLAHWMGKTYGADAKLADYAAFFSIVCAPLSVASAAHLFPHVFFNVLMLLPAVIWSMLLLYRGLPVVLRIPGEQGMLMASALVGWLLVAMVSLLGLSAGLWTVGLGPAIAA